MKVNLVKKNKRRVLLKQRPFRFGLINPNKPFDICFSYLFLLDKSMLYEFEDPETRNDINKLFGITFGLFGIHKNSFRVGYNSKGESIDLYFYVYNDGKRNFHRSYSINPVYTEKIVVAASATNQHRYGNNQIEVKLKIEIPKTWQSETHTEVLDAKHFFYMNWFYFGGQAKAPHKIEFKTAGLL